MAATYGTVNTGIDEKGDVEKATVQVIEGTEDDDATTFKKAYQNLKEAPTFNEKKKYFTIIYGILCTSLAVSTFLTLLNIIPLYTLIVGTLHLQDCPIENRVPLYLIVDGIMFIFRTIIFWCCRCAYIYRNPELPLLHNAAKPNPAIFMINLFLFVWLICGSVWVFGNHPDFDDASSPLYCNKLVYVTAYVYLIIQWIALPVVLAFMCCVMGTVLLAFLC